jgi:hypothetical protein
MEIDKNIELIIKNDVSASSVDIDNAISTLKELAEKGQCTMPEYVFSGPEQLGYDNDGNPKWACRCRIINNKTGLTRLGIDAMLDEGDITKIVEVQESFFKEYEYRDLNFAPFCHYYSLKGTVPIVPLQDGDIIISSSTEFSWWSIGHCAMVIDAKNGITVEAIGVGDDSTYGYVSALSRRPTLIVLRPKLEKEEISEIVEYVDNELLGITYDPTVGVLSRKYNEEIGATQCAHIFWYAFYKHGYDIDSNGGAVVTPKDIANSEYFEVVQVSGFNPQTLWGN